MSFWGHKCQEGTISALNTKVSWAVSEYLNTEVFGFFPAVVLNGNNGIGQVVTTLKNTDKPVTEVPFPALTICGSGFCTIVIIIYHYIVCSAQVFI